MSKHHKWALFNLIAAFVLLALLTTACAPTVPDSDVTPASSSTVAPPTTVAPVTTTTLGPPTPLVTEDFLRRQNDIAVVGGLWAQVWFEALLGGGLIDRQQAWRLPNPPTSPHWDRDHQFEWRNYWWAYSEQAFIWLTITLSDYTYQPGIGTVVEHDCASTDPSVNSTGEYIPVDNTDGKSPVEFHHERKITETDQLRNEAHRESAHDGRDHLRGRRAPGGQSRVELRDRILAREGTDTGPQQQSNETTVGVNIEVLEATSIVVAYVTTDGRVFCYVDINAAGDWRIRIDVNLRGEPLGSHNFGILKNSDAWKSTSTGGYLEFETHDDMVRFLLGYDVACVLCADLDVAARRGQRRREPPADAAASRAPHRDRRDPRAGIVARRRISHHRCHRLRPRLCRQAVQSRRVSP